MDTPTFYGGVSYTQTGMAELFKHITYRANFSILEFGSGNSTEKLHEHFKKNVENLVFYSYESDPRFLKPHAEIKFILYDDQNVKSIEIPQIAFDLILVDGSTTDKRAIFSKIRENIKDGTILLIDYFNHFESVSDQLAGNFDYDLLASNNEPFIAYGEHSWCVVRVKRAIIR
jgi:hypothetical protein